MTTKPSRPSRRYTPPKVEERIVFHKSPRPFRGLREAAQEGRRRMEFRSQLSPAGQAMLRVFDHQVAAPALEAERVRREADRERLAEVVDQLAEQGVEVSVDALETIAQVYR